MQSPAPLPDQPELAACSAEALALLSRVEQAIWLYDLTHHRVVWANPAALGLWKAESLAELQARNFDPTSLGTAERLANLRLRLARGEHLVEQWVLYPRGEPVPVRCRFTGVMLPNGEIGMMVEVVSAEPDQDEASYELRAIEAVRQTPLMISLATPTGGWLMHNPAAEALLNRLGHHHVPGLDNFLALFAEPALAAALRETAIADGAAVGTLRLAGRLLRMHEVTIRRVIDPVTGHLSLIVSQQDVTRAVRLERRLKQALVRERALAELQRQFLAVTSHDFRTPLSIIDSAARRIAKLAGSPAAIAERVESIRRAVRRMTQSIDKTLATAMIAEGKAPFRPERTDLVPLIRDAVAALQALHPARRIELTLSALPMLMVDPALTERVIENVLGNAIKYSPEDSPITLVAAVEGEAVVVTITDHGIGIPADDLPQLFTRYFRGGNARRIKGTGIGLHAVRLVMDLHHGTIDLASHEGQGTTVRIAFPAGPALSS